VLIDLRQGVGQRKVFACAQALRLRGQPLHAWFQPSRPRASQQRAKPVLVTSPNTAHSSSLAANAPQGSADFQSAVSPISNRLAVRPREAAGFRGAQQNRILRYERDGRPCPLLSSA